MKIILNNNEELFEEQQLTIAELLAETIRRIHSEDSVSSLFIE